MEILRTRKNIEIMIKKIVNKYPKIKSLLFRIISRIQRRPYRYFQFSKGVIHVGANVGQEKELYSYYNLNVLWIEPIPEMFEKLKQNIYEYPKQAAIQELVSDSDGDEVFFNISSHGGVSSSILDFEEHSTLWPEISFNKKIKLRTITLDSLIKKYSVNISKYNFLVLDVQGAELLVLKGSKNVLKNIKYIQVEAADFKMYKNNPAIDEIEKNLFNNGFKEFARHKLKDAEIGKCCYEIFYKKI
jgi:FkbM family methyltransferase